MSQARNTAGVPEDNLKQKLVMRVAFAGVLIALLLATLAVIDYLGQPREEPVASGPTFNAPVPVPKKEISQPVKPAEPAPEPAPPAPQETPAAPPPPPVAEGAPPLPPSAPAAAADVPPRPAVSAQPALPPSSSRAPVARSPQPQTPAEGTSARGAAEPERTIAPAEPKPEMRVEIRPEPRPQPAPPRLFSGFAVQAGVFADAQRAEELRAKLTLHGIPSTMEARVQVGPFKTREEAEAARVKMKALGIDGILLSPKGVRR